MPLPPFAHYFPDSRLFPFLVASCFLFVSQPAYAQDDGVDFEEEEQGPSPAEVLAAAPADHWLPIPTGDLMIMFLPDDADGKPRRMIIQLLPAKFSGGHVRNVRKLAAAHWWDGTKIYRVARNFVTQFGGSPDNKALPKNLEIVPESEYFNAALGAKRDIDMKVLKAATDYSNHYQGKRIKPLMQIIYENYGAKVGFGAGWPIGIKNGKAYPLNCRGSLSPAHYDPPDTGSGAEISIVTGEEARSLDATFGNVGRVIEGLEHAINLPFGEDAGGFYGDKSRHIPIQSIRLATELPVAEQPRYQYLASYSPFLLQYLEAHGGYNNICTVPVPIRPVPVGTATDQPAQD